MKPEIGAARAVACDELALLHASAFDRGWSAAEIGDLFALPNVIALAAHAPDLAGLLIARAQAGEAEILTLAVAPTHRRQGVARALLDAALAAAAVAKAEAVFLEVEVENFAALGLYRGAGFREAGRRNGYYATPDGPRDALALRLDLS